MHEFLTTQALLIGYGSVFFSGAFFLWWAPFRIRQLLGWSSLVIWASVLVSFFIPEVGESVLFLLNSGVKALWKTTE